MQKPEAQKGRVTPQHQEAVAPVGGVGGCLTAGPANISARPPSFSVSFQSQGLGSGFKGSSWERALAGWQKLTLRVAGG